MAKIGILIGILVVIGVIFYSFTHLGNSGGIQNSTTTPPQSSAEATTTTYENGTYHFAFDYPKTSGTSTLSFVGNDVRDPTDLSARFEGKLEPLGLTVEVDAKLKNFSSSYFDTQFTAEKKERANADFKLSTTTTDVGGISAFTIEGVGKGLKEEEILLEHDGYIYSIGYTNRIPDNVVNTVLRTFRFTGI